MKKTQREEFLILNLLQQEIPDGPGTSFTVGWPCLCQWCRYAHWTGSPCSDDGGLECDHPLWKLELWNENEVWESSDCWGFRPKYRREDCVDVVGLWLQGKYVDWNSIPEAGRGKEMKMAFVVTCVKEHLIKNGFVYTVRGKGINYGPPTDTVKGRGCIVEVTGVGKCFVQKVSPEPVSIPGILEYHGYVQYSGFKTIDEWWATIEAFHAVGGYLWRVERVDQ